MPTNTQNILFYKTKEWNISLKVFFKDETLWANQKQIAEIFGVDRSVISRHIKNIFESWELDKNMVCAIFAHTTQHGAIAEKTQTKEVSFYNLDLILSVWYRVNSYKATQFRIWANSILKEYIIKGFTMDDERLKNGEKFWKDYFDELLARIREIRASERRFYQKVTDIYATSINYDPKSPLSKNFFSRVQNTFLYAVSDKTAGEIIYSRADSKKENMWLTTWNSQKSWGKILSTDIQVWKNYLSESEISDLHLLISGYLDFAELQARKWKLMYMEDWIKKTEVFLKLNDMKMPTWKWTVSHEKAIKRAKEEFEIFRIEQDKNFESDFDAFVTTVQSKKIK